MYQYSLRRSCPMGRSYAKDILVVLTLLAPAENTAFRAGQTGNSGLIQVALWCCNEDGSIGLRRYRKNINAAANATQFERASKDAKGMVPGGIRYAESNPGTADRVIDGDPATWSTMGRPYTWSWPRSRAIPRWKSSRWAVSVCASSSLWTGRIGGMAATRCTKSCRQVFTSAGFGSSPMRETRPHIGLST